MAEIESLPESGQEPMETAGAEQTRSSAAQVKRCKRQTLVTVRLVQNSLDIGANRVEAAGQRIKIAIDALADAKRNMDIETARRLFEQVIPPF
jgi:hypothetical protein